MDQMDPQRRGEEEGKAPGKTSRSVRLDWLGHCVSEVLPISPEWNKGKSPSLPLFQLQSLLINSI